jgi:uncharacterized protein YjbJ (UPF0337 family)
LRLPLAIDSAVFRVAWNILHRQRVQQSQSGHKLEGIMDKDRVKGTLKQAKGSIKEMAGKVSGDAKLKAEGKADKAAGKVQNAVGGLKDTLRGK